MVSLVAVANPATTSCRAAGAWLGIGAAWNAEEAAGLGLGFPPLAHRFEMLEETLQICQQMWDASDERPFHGTHYHLDRALNVPAPLHRPRILIGGGGENKTLRFVAKYADACNLFAGPELERKFDVLREHCATEGRDYDDIERTAQLVLDLGGGGENTGAFLVTLERLAGLGIQGVQGKMPRVWELERVERFRREIIPVVAEL